MNDIKSYTTPGEIHSSIFILGIKLFLILFIIDFLYVLIDVLTLEISQSDFFHHITLILLFIHIIKSIVQILLVFQVVFRWLYHKYYIDFDQKILFEQKGFFHTQEKMFDLKNLRDVEVQQRVLGKIFHYGNIILNVTASGGYEEKIIISKIQDPHKNVILLKNCI